MNTNPTNETLQADLRPPSSAVLNEHQENHWLRTAIDHHAIISVTDEQGIIIEANERFCEICGYEKEELIGRDHNLLNSGYHEREFFETMWQTISSGQVWQGEICNRQKNGELFWVNTTIIPTYEHNQTRYMAIRTDVSRLKELTEAHENTQREQTLSDQRLLKLMDLNPSLVCARNSNGAVIFANRAVAETVGYAVEELVSGEFPEEALPFNQADYQEVVESGKKLIRPNHVMTDADGQQRNYHTIQVPLSPDFFGESVVMSVSTDVTEMRTLMHRMEALTAALNEHSIVAITDSRGDIVEVNDKFCEISKYPREELLGQNHRLINSGDHPREFFTNMWRTISRGKVWKDQIKNRAKGGSTYWVQTTIVPIQGKSRPSAYIAVRTDITDLKRIEQQRTDRLRALRSLYEITNITRHKDFTMPQIYESILRDIVPTCWHESEITKCRIRMQGQEYFTPEFETTPWSYSTNVQIGPEYLGLVEISYSERPQTESDELYYEEDRFIVEEIARHLAITIENRQMADQLITSHEKQARADLMGFIAHEVNNGLGATSGFLSLGIEALKSNRMKQTLMYMEKTEHALIKTSTVVSDTLEIHGNTNRPRHNLDIVDLMYNACMMMQARLKRYSTTIYINNTLLTEFEHDIDLPPIQGDFKQLDASVSNIIKNALESLATSESSVEHEIRVDLSQDNSEVVIDISNSGPTISGDPERLFRYKYSEKRKAGIQYEGGSGMGLYLVREYIEKNHNGHISVITSPIVHFIIRLPVSTDNSPTKPVKELMYQGLGTHNYFPKATGLNRNVREQLVSQKLKILLLDDESEVHDILTSILKSDEVYSAFTIEDALPLLENKPNVLITDYQLRGETGLDFINKVKSLNLRIPIIMISGNPQQSVTGEKSLVDRLKETKISGFLSKPFTDLELLHRALLYFRWLAALGQSNGRMMFVDDEPELREIAGDYLDGYPVDLFESYKSANRALLENDYSLVISDKNLQDGNGLDLLETARGRNPLAYTCLITGETLDSIPEHYMREIVSQAINKADFDFGDIERLANSITKQRGTV